MPVADDRALPAGSGAHFVAEGCLLSRSLCGLRHRLVIEMHGAPRLRDRSARNLASALGAVLQDAQNLLRLSREILPARADGAEQSKQHVYEVMLQLHVTHPARPIARLERVQSGAIGIEGVQIGKDDVALDLSRVLHARM